MAEFTTVPISQVPAPLTPSTERQEVYDDFVRSLSELNPDEVGVLIADEGETARGLRMSVKRAAKRLNVSVIAYESTNGKVCAALA